MDYQSNSKKDRLELGSKPEKKIERVVTSEVLVQKKSLGRKFRELFIEADFKSVVHYVIYEVVLPAARNTIVDASTKGVERMMYGESAVRRRSYGPGTRITYNTPIYRGSSYGDPRARNIAPPVSGRPLRNSRDDIILASREEASLVLERMNDIIDQFEVVSVADLNDLVGVPSSHVDNKWGWQYLGDVQIRQLREGFLLDLPPADPIN